jgi:hypothetical protein
LDKTRSASLDDTDCIECPLKTVGCRERTESEILVSNRFYEPTNPEYEKFSRLAFLCEEDDKKPEETAVFLDTNIGRCILGKDVNLRGTYSYEITLFADCKHYEGDVANIWKINS